MKNELKRHFAVATFLHRGVFKSAQRREWHVDADTKTLRHMTRGRVLRVDAELHDGQRLQVFNVHQATSGDMQLQQHTWQVLAKCITECRHQRILLGGECVECKRQWSQGWVRGIQCRAYKAGGRGAHQFCERHARATDVA